MQSRKGNNVLKVCPFSPHKKAFAEAPEEDLHPWPQIRRPRKEALGMQICKRAG